MNDVQMTLTGVIISDEITAKNVDYNFLITEANFQKFSHTEMIKTIRQGRGDLYPHPYPDEDLQVKDLSNPSIIFFFRCGKMVKRIF